MWEDTAFRVGEARARISIDVQGNEASGFRPFLKLPDEWLREFRKPRLSALVMPAVLGAAGLLLLVLFIKRIGERSATNPHRYHWRAYGALAAAAAGLSLLASLNQWPLLMMGYDTATPLGSHLSGLLLERLMALVLAGFVVFLAALGADVFLQWAVGDRAHARPSRGSRRGSVCAVVGLGARYRAASRPQSPGLGWRCRCGTCLERLRYRRRSRRSRQAPFLAILALCVLVVMVSAAARFLRPSGRSWRPCWPPRPSPRAGPSTVPQFALLLRDSGARRLDSFWRSFAPAASTSGHSPWLSSGSLSTGPAWTLIEQPDARPSLEWDRAGGRARWRRESPAGAISCPRAQRASEPERVVQLDPRAGLVV